MGPRAVAADVAGDSESESSDSSGHDGLEQSGGSGPESSEPARSGTRRQPERPQRCILAAAAAPGQLPALIYGVERGGDGYGRSEGAAVVEPLCRALQTLGWGALDGWDGWDQSGMPGPASGNASEAPRWRASWRVWIAAAAQGLPPGGDSGGGGRRGSRAEAAAEDEGRARRAAVNLKAYSSLDALAGACLDPAAPASGGARACADLAWRLLPLLRRGGLGFAFNEKLESTVEGRLLAVAGSLGVEGLAKEVLRVMAGDFDGAASRGVAGAVASESASGALAAVQSNLGSSNKLDYRHFPVITRTVHRFGWSGVGSEVLAVLKATQRNLEVRSRACLRDTGLGYWGLGTVGWI